AGSEWSGERRGHGEGGDGRWGWPAARGGRAEVGRAGEGRRPARAETVELLQAMIRNACVNDGTAESGHEVRSAEVLEWYLEGAGLDVEAFEPTPGRRSVVSRIDGHDPAAPTLLLIGHTHVVPVPPAPWP